MHSRQLSRIIAMSEATARKGKASEVEKRVKSGRCLLCNTAAQRRGLCMSHYQTFLRRLSDKGDKVAQAEFEAACIREGLVLAAGDVRKIKTDDPFSRL